MSEGLLKRVEETQRELVEALGRVYSELSSSGGERERWREGIEIADAHAHRVESLRTAISEVLSTD